MKRFALLFTCLGLLVVGNGCCHHAPWGGGGYYGGGQCNPCSPCGYNAGYGGYSNAYATGTTMQAGLPVYTTAGAPIIAPVTASAPLNPLPLY